MSLASGTKLGPYEILEPIGAGGMGEVYRARDTKLKRDVAVKVLPEHLSENKDFLARFEREAQAVAALSHPNILAIHDLGNEGGVAYAVMELLEGESLRALLENGPLPRHKAIAFVSQVTEGLAAAHDKGVIHRDIKPDNLFVTSDGRIKILDFGLAKVRSESTGQSDLSDSETQARQTTPGTVVGTVGYMSPEQVRGLDCDERSDIFSVGVVLYEMLSAKRPFRGETSADTMSSILKEDPPDISVPRSLEHILRRCLEKQRTKRFQSSRDLNFALEAVSDLDDAKPNDSPSIAVLPFTDMSPQKDQDYFCEGMAEELINGLSSIEGLRVAARSSAFQFKGGAQDIRRIGEALSVKTVLEGSVRTAGQKLRVTAQLNNAADGYQLWSKRYDRDMEDVFAIQDEIAADIVGALQLELGSAVAQRERHTQNQEAYHLYLRGRHHWFARTKNSLQTAMRFFQEAAEKDPDYALAHAGQADFFAILGLYGFLEPEIAFTKAKAAAERALATGDHLAEAHVSLAWIRCLYDWDWAGAEQEFERAIEINPNHVIGLTWFGLFLGCMGRFDEGEAHLKRAQALDPLSSYVTALAAGLYEMADRDEEALAEGQRALEIDEDHLVSLWVTTVALMRMSRHEEAIARSKKATAISQRASFYLGILGRAHARADHAPEAREILTELEERSKTEYVPVLHRAWILSALGARDEALELLETARQGREPMLLFSKMALFDDLRSDRGFADFERRMGLEP